MPLFHRLRTLITPRIIILIIVLAIISVSGIVIARVTNTDIRPANLRAMLFQLGALAPLALVSALAGVLVVPVIPASIFQVGAGLAFGSWLGLVYVLIADVIGASIGFVVARYWGKTLLARYLDVQTQAQLDGLTKRISWRGVILLRLLPGPAYPLVSFASGFSSISYPTYIVASFIGVFPGLALLVLAGDLVERSPLLAFGLAALVLLGLVIAGRGLSKK
ncbi:MAG: VTT domain-containing protein [Chloroflexi bacterium]|nr:VTT domain-containing protein [Chloroflexota bacterium]